MYGETAFCILVYGGVRSLYFSIRRCTVMPRPQTCCIAILTADCVFLKCSSLVPSSEFVERVMASTLLRLRPATTLIVRSRQSRILAAGYHEKVDINMLDTALIYWLLHYAVTPSFVTFFHLVIQNVFLHKCI